MALPKRSILVGALLSSSSFATTVIAVRASNEVVLAADSRIQVITGRQSAEVVGCKIHSTHGIVWAHIGYFSNPQSGFDIIAIAEVALGSQGALRERLVRFAESALGPLQRALSGLRQSNPEEWARSGPTPLTIVAAAIERDMPYLATLTFSTNDPSPLKYSVRLCPGDCSSEIEYVSFGVHDEADEKFDSTPHYFALMGWREGMRGLLDAVATIHPDKVGPPYSILEYTKAGITWIEGGLCANSPPQLK